MSLSLARIDDKYEIVAKIKEGGMGEIYKVRHRLLDEIRVVKVLHPELVGDRDLNERFAREARAAIKLRHPNIVQIFDFTLDASGAGLIVMEYIRGTDLQQLIARPELPSVALAVEIACQGLRALGYLHRHGFVHRDISPDNLMLSTDVEGRPLVKIIDLGIAKRRGSESGLTASGVFLGKFRYSSPEHFGAQGSGGIEARSDLYTFGLVFYELLTGQYPIRGESTSQLIAGHLFQPPRDFSETDPEARIPEPLRRAVLQTLAKEPSDRFASAEELIKCIQDLRPGQPLSHEMLEESRSFTTGATPRATVAAPVSPQSPGEASGESVEAEPETLAGPISRLVIEVEDLLQSGKLIEADRMLFQARELHGPAPELTTMRDRLDTLYQHGVETEVRSMLSLADARLEEEDFTRALEILDKACATAPPNSPLREEVEKVEAKARRENHEWQQQQSVAEIERRLLVLIRRKEFVQARAVLTAAEAELDSPTIEPLRRLLSRTVDDWIQGLVKQAGVAFEAERFDTAADCLDKVLTVDPDNEWIRNRLERARSSHLEQQDEMRLQEENEAKAPASGIRPLSGGPSSISLPPGPPSSLRTTPLSPGLMKAYTDIEGLRASGDCVAAWRRLNGAIEEFGEIDALMTLRRQIAEEILEDEEKTP